VRIVLETPAGSYRKSVDSLRRAGDQVVRFRQPHNFSDRSGVTGCTTRTSGPAIALSVGVARAKTTRGADIVLWFTTYRIRATPPGVGL
jgi:hypothetical protein